MDHNLFGDELTDSNQSLVEFFRALTATGEKWSTDTCQGRVELVAMRDDVPDNRYDLTQWDDGWNEYGDMPEECPPFFTTPGRGWFLCILGHHHLHTTPPSV